MPTVMLPRRMLRKLVAKLMSSVRRKVMKADGRPMIGGLDGHRQIIRRRRA
jgi:hypothetical protein